VYRRSAYVNAGLFFLLLLLDDIEAPLPMEAEAALLIHSGVWR
jgi:hypothetical protein